MDSQFYRPGNSYGFQYGKVNDSTQDTNNLQGREQKSKKKDDDLIIEENTVYEVDRDCYERLKKQKRHK